MEAEVAGEVQELILKEKATFNLLKTVLSKLEDFWIEIRKMRGDKAISNHCSILSKRMAICSGEGSSSLSSFGSFFTIW